MNLRFLICLLAIVTGCGGGGGGSQAAKAAGLIPCTPGPPKSSWGLRNMDLPYLNSWTTSHFQSEFTAHAAGHLAFWLLWDDVEPSPGTFTWTKLDRMLDWVKSVAADPVIVFHLKSGWAMYDGAPFTGPKDLNTSAVPSWPTPAGGYSPSLHAVSLQVARRIAETFCGRAFMRFHNEAWADWALGQPTGTGQISPQMAMNMNNYILSYLTFRDAAEAIDGGASNMEFEVSHGSIPRNRLLPRLWFQQGESNPGLQPELIPKFQAYFERNLNTLPTGVTPPISNWSEVTLIADPATPKNLKLDFWLDSFASWTGAGYFDFVTWHPHGKPLFEDMERDLFSASIPAPPWLAAEAAFELLDPAQWPPGLTGPALDQFVMEDFARKWCTLLSNGDVFNSPIIGAPYPKYIGLYQPAGGSAIAPFPSNAAFIHLSNLLGRPDGVAILREDTYAHYRFDKSGLGYQVDAVWRRSTLDGDNGSQDLVIQAPPGYTRATLLDPVGTFIAGYQSVTQVTVADVGQAPRFVVWKP